MPDQEIIDLIKELKAAPATDRAELVRRSGREGEIAHWIEAEDIADSIATVLIPVEAPEPP